ncbi:hypothetical protein HII28_18330 [Planctomonas sp. JC2975]|uniref:TfoX/Sxy family protein n=1 Tax=Planctomonas sp. JC2975 TaxID=2729626 RepID=UPI00147610EF|nr:TfoX/Sxy family protein [Planctomonas sp. JC2975]NNC13822.1 hypothetical protein [Planctomonas sp. JC2975]
MPTAAQNRRQKFPESYAIFDPIAAEFVAGGDVAIGRMFGSEGLSLRGKVFAFVGFTGRLYAKLPEERVGELVAAGDAEPAVMRDRPMREWVTALPERPDVWPAIVAEAYAFIDSITE